MAYKIMLDAGHYGKYNKGVISGYYESDMVWELHNYLKTELESYGFEVGTTRKDKNKDLSVYERGLASKGYDLFLSLHSNAASGQSADYVALFHLVNDTTTKVDEVSKAVAKKLAPVIAKVMNVKQGYQVLTRPVDFDRDGDGLLNDNYYGVLHGADVANTAGIIIEHSFHTNPTACKWLMDSNNLKKLAVEEAKVIAEVYGMKKKTTSSNNTTNTTTNTTTNVTTNNKDNVVENKTNTTTQNTTYRVWLGAHSSKVLAERQLAKVKAAGFNAYIILVNGVYRIQAGAYSSKSSAESVAKKLNNLKFGATVTTQSGTAVSSTTSTTTTNTLKVGDKVKMKAGAYIYGTQKKFASFVYNSTLYVRQINGSRVVVSTTKNGEITGAVTKSDLIKI